MNFDNKDIMELVELNRRWLNTFGFFPKNKDKLKDKTILIYCEDFNINGDDTINFFIKLCESYISNIKIKLCNDIDLIEKFNDIDYYYFVKPSAVETNSKHLNFINKYLTNDKLYLLSIQKYNIKEDILFEHINIRNNNYLYDLEFHNRMSRQRCLKEDCVEAFINDNKDILENKKILVYHQYKYGSRLHTLSYFTDLINEKINFKFCFCPTFDDFKDKLNDYDIFFIEEEPFYPDYNIKDEIEEFKKNKDNKELFLFRTENDYINNVGLCEIIKCNYKNKNYFMRFINRIEDY